MVWYINTQKKAIKLDNMMSLYTREHWAYKDKYTEKQKSWIDSYEVCCDFSDNDFSFTLEDGFKTEKAAQKFILILLRHAEEKTSDIKTPKGTGYLIFIT